MSNRTAATPEVVTDPRLKVHADLVEKYNAAENAGVKAGAARKIADIELDLTLAEVEFVPFVRPTTYKSTSIPINVDETRATIVSLGDLLKTETVPDSVKSTADRRLSSLINALVKRGHTVTDPRTGADVAPETVAA